MNPVANMTGWKSLSPLTTVKSKEDKIFWKYLHENDKHKTDYKVRGQLNIIMINRQSLKSAEYKTLSKNIGKKNEKNSGDTDKSTKTKHSGCKIIKQAH